MLETAIQEVPQLEDDSEFWIEALPARTYHTSAYGDVPITLDKLERLVKNFNDNVRGQDIATDFEHGMDVAKGRKASGWYRGFEVRPSSSNPSLPALFAHIELTEEARKEIQDNQWKYFSLEWDDEYTDSQRTDTVPDVIIGGAFTNRPVAKHTLPVNFSETMWEELDDDTKKQFAVWSTAFVNDLPDSSFLFIESGGSKDGEGKTKPRSLRHFPYKGPDGKVDLPHLRNAIARIPQAGSWLSSSMKDSLQSRARKLLSGASKAMAEGGATLELFEEMLDVFDESKEWEHSEPGTGSPPLPRTDEDGSDDPAIRGGWRRETPPIAIDPEDSSKGGNTLPFELTDNQAHELLRTLELPVESDGEKVVEATKLLFGELAESKRTADAATQEKEFAEKYPQFWGEHNKLMQENREHNAKAFTENVKSVRRAKGVGLVTTNQQLSTLAQEKLQKLHMAFAEGTATVEDFEDCVKTIVNGGIVQFGELGTTDHEDIPILDLDTSDGVNAGRKLFGEIVEKIQSENPDWDFKKCLDEAGAKHPDLAEAYMKAPTA